MRKELRAFGCAIRGIGGLVQREPHARIHAVATVGVCGMAVGLGCDGMEWAVLGLAMGLVWVAEAFNTAIERLADRVEPEWDAEIGRIKDMAAGGVLLAAIVAVVVGVGIFGRKLGVWWWG